MWGDIGWAAPLHPCCTVLGSQGPQPGFSYSFEDPQGAELWLCQGNRVSQPAEAGMGLLSWGDGLMCIRREPGMLPAWCFPRKRGRDWPPPTQYPLVGDENECFEAAAQGGEEGREGGRFIRASGQGQAPAWDGEHGWELAWGSLWHHCSGGETEAGAVESEPGAHPLQPR